MCQMNGCNLKPESLPSNVPSPSAPGCVIWISEYTKSLSLGCTEKKTKQNKTKHFVSRASQWGMLQMLLHKQLFIMNVWDTQGDQGLLPGPKTSIFLWLRPRAASYQGVLTIDVQLLQLHRGRAHGVEGSWWAYSQGSPVRHRNTDHPWNITLYMKVGQREKRMGRSQQNEARRVFDVIEMIIS